MTDPNIYNSDYYDDMRGIDESSEIFSYFLSEFTKYIELNGTVLDAGCGRGELLQLLALRPDCISYGLDFSEVAVEHTRDLVESISDRTAADRVVCGSITDTGVFPEGSFDTVFMMDIVETPRTAATHRWFGKCAALVVIKWKVVSPYIPDKSATLYLSAVTVGSWEAPRAFSA